MSKDMTQTSTPIAWHHSSLTVEELDRAIAFYVDCLGYEVLFVARGITEEADSILGLRGVSADVAQLRLAGAQAEAIAPPARTIVRARRRGGSGTVKWIGLPTPCGYRGS